MIKRTISCMLLLAVALGTTSTIQAQEESYVMWETITITPDNTKLKVLGENMRKHNMAYHNEGPYMANVYNITTGPNIGKIVWQMGPLTYSHLDSRPSEGGHDEDWRDNVMPYVKKMTNGEYWKQDDELSNISMLDPTKVSHPILFIRYREVKPEQGHNINYIFSQISETVKAMEGENPWGLFYNEFAQGYTIGRHMAGVSFYKNWTEFDEDDDFKKTFLKTHGENAWDPFIKNVSSTFSNSWDEIWEFNSKLSGHD